MRKKGDAAFAGKQMTPLLIPKLPLKKPDKATSPCKDHCLHLRDDSKCQAAWDRAKVWKCCLCTYIQRDGKWTEPWLKA